MYELEEPDKGRAWMVAFSACIINLILSGLARMIGYLYVAVIKTYGLHKTGSNVAIHPQKFNTRSL
ncbi:hypothetical protein AVEN_172021-1, partial [Araneus ventricosus]